jgi:hypothetical protein
VTHRTDLIQVEPLIIQAVRIIIQRLREVEGAQHLLVASVGEARVRRYDYKSVRSHGRKQ